MNLSLDDAVRHEPVPDSADAKERTKIRARQLGSDGERPGAHRHPLRQRAILGLATVGVAAFFIAPVGQSMAERVGDLIGLGANDAPTPQVVTADSVSLGSSTGPGGTTYSVTASRAQGQGDVCMSLDFANEKKSTTTCGYAPGEARYGTPTPTDQVALTSPFYYAANEFGLGGALGDSTGVVHGNAAANVESVAVTYEDESGQRVEVPTEIFSLQGDQQGSIGASQPLKAYVAFPPAADLGSLEVAAYGTDGQLLGSFNGGEHMSAPSAVDPGAGIEAPDPTVRPTAK